MNKLINNFNKCTIHYCANKNKVEFEKSINSIYKKLLKYKEDTNVNDLKFKFNIMNRLEELDQKEQFELIVGLLLYTKEYYSENDIASLFKYFIELITILNGFKLWVKD